MNRQGAEYLTVTKPPLPAERRCLRLTNPAYRCRSAPRTRLWPAPEARTTAAERLCRTGFDVPLRLSPFLPQYRDLRRTVPVRCRKPPAEFLRVND